MIGRATYPAQGEHMSRLLILQKLTRQNKHKQMMGNLYIECMIFVPGNALQAYSHVLIQTHHGR